MDKYKTGYESICILYESIEEAIAILIKVKKNILDKHPGAKDLIITTYNEYDNIVTNIEYRIPFSDRDYQEEKSKEAFRKENRKKEYIRLKKEFENEDILENLGSTSDISSAANSMAKGITTKNANGDSTVMCSPIIVNNSDKS